MDVSPTDYSTRSIACWKESRRTVTAVGDFFSILCDDRPAGGLYRGRRHAAERKELMDWQAWREQLSFWAWIRLSGCWNGRPARSSQSPPRARLMVQQHDKRESPTIVSGTAAALAQALPIRGGDGAELGAVSRVAIMDPIVRPIEANADEGTLGWWSSTKSAQTASGTIEVLLSANTDDSAGAGSDDSLLSRLDFPSTTLSPVSGVEPQLGAASGILAGL